MLRHTTIEELLDNPQVTDALTEQVKRRKGYKLGACRDLTSWAVVRHDARFYDQGPDHPRQVECTLIVRLDFAGVPVQEDEVYFKLKESDQFWHMVHDEARKKSVHEIVTQLYVACVELLGGDQENIDKADFKRKSRYFPDVIAWMELCNWAWRDVLAKRLKLDKPVVFEGMDGKGHKITVDRVLELVKKERVAQDEKWGEQNWPATPVLTPHTFRDWHRLLPTSEEARNACEYAKDQGTVSWTHIALEELCEAAEATSYEELEDELVQIAAVCVAWIESLHRNGHPGKLPLLF